MKTIEKIRAQIDRILIERVTLDGDVFAATRPVPKLTNALQTALTALEKYGDEDRWYIDYDSVVCQQFDSGHPSKGGPVNAQQALEQIAADLGVE